jgi:hypothetical protein
MLKRIAAITGIFICSWVAWVILTMVIWIRTDEKKATMTDAVGELWGTEHTQTAPELSATWTTTKREEVKWRDGVWEAARDEKEERQEEAAPPDATGLMGAVTTTLSEEKIVSEEIESGKPSREPGKKKVVVDWKRDPNKRHFRLEEHHHRASLMIDGTDAQADLGVDYRKKGLMWFSTYGVGFRSSYTVRNPIEHPIDVSMRFTFPSASAIYDNMKVTVPKNKGARVTAEEGAMAARFTIPPRSAQEVIFAYHSRGMDRWSYSFGADVKMVRNFRLVMRTDFESIDFPKGSISPDAKKMLEDGSGWRLVWDKESVVSGLDIGMLMPHKINPGPLAQKMSLHAPVSLFFFFFVMFILQVLRSIRMHPMNYFFIAASFFSFNLLFSYLVDHITVFMAFGISSAVSILLVASYLRIVVGLRFALLEAGVSQLIYQVLFGLAHFLEGYTGLTITVGAIVTLAIVMHLTARTDWENVFRLKPRTPEPTTQSA